MTHEELKNFLIQMIQNIKSQDIEFGKHLEENIIFDDINETFMYIGDKDFLT